MRNSKFLQEFKAFAMKGNVIDMAVGVIIGGAFSKIVSSLVADLVTPLLGLLIGGIDLKDQAWVISEAVKDEAGNILTPAVSLNYGNFLQNTIDFLIIAFSIFLMIKVISSLHRKKEAQPAPAPQPPAPSKEEVLLTEIRDLLKERK